MKIKNTKMAVDCQKANKMAIDSVADRRKADRRTAVRQFSLRPSIFEALVRGYENDMAIDSPISEALVRGL